MDNFSVDGHSNGLGGGDGFLHIAARNLFVLGGDGDNASAVAALDVYACEPDEEEAG